MLRTLQKQVVGRAIHSAKSLLGRNKMFAQWKRLVGSAPRNGGDPKKKKRILIYTYKWWPAHLAVEGLLGTALHLRDAEVTFFICDHPKEACDNFRMEQDRRITCAQCLYSGGEFLKTWNGGVLKTSDFLRPADRDAIERAAASNDLEALRRFEIDGIKIGQAAEASAIRYLRVNSLSSRGEEGLRTQQAYLKAAVETHIVCDRLLASHEFDAILLQCGKSYSESILIDVARKRGIPYFTYDLGLRTGTLMFRLNESISIFDLSPLWKHNAERPLSEGENRELDQYLRDRQFGKHSVINQWPRPVFSDKPFDAEAIHRNGGKVFVLFTNVAWDTAWIGIESCFPTMFDWLEHTVRLFLDRPKDTLIIRVHPAEIRMTRGITRERADDFLKARFGTLPENIKIVLPEDPLSSYSFISVADAVLVYTSTIGIEAAVAGKPVIVASNAHYCGYGFTKDAHVEAEYRRCIEDLDGALAGWNRAAAVQNARKYAYLLFFKYAVPFPFVSMDGPSQAPVFHVDKVSELEPGRNPDLDEICSGLLQLRPIFVKQ